MTQLIALFACNSDSSVDTAHLDTIEEVAFSCPVDTRFWAPSTDVEACIDADGELHGPWRRLDGEDISAEARFDHGVRTGLYSSFHADGGTHVAGRYVDGNKDGLWRSTRSDRLNDWEERWDDGELAWRSEYGIDGELRSEIRFESGERHGVATWYHQDGTPRTRLEYDRGHKHGVAIRWHADGQLESMGSYDQDVRDGSWFAWDRDGGLVSEEVWKLGALANVEGAATDADPICPDGTVLVVEELEHGIVEVCETPSGVRHGPSITRYGDGSLRRVGAYAGGLPSGEWMSWCPNGTPASRGSYALGLRADDWDTWSCATGELLMKS
ncbi:MAG: hypothetical protein GY913_17420 [Proteobacteria bacterium]|nr:hypothetical protein [Pseudomonadota bacterium]MCP4918687.1 hypothetical protein [Pseudomonadota bacterium]